MANDLIKVGTEYGSKVVAWINADLANPEKALSLVQGYNLGAEINSAIIKMMEVQGWETCTPSSIMTSLRDLAIQGLSVSKNQAYFIKRWNKSTGENRMTLMRSVYGTEAVLKYVLPSLVVYANVVYEGDSYDYLTDDVRGFNYIENIKSSLKNRSNPIEGAYCNLVDKDTGVRIYAEVMNADEIKASWSHSSNQSQTVHKEFPQEMAKRTVINRAVKHFLNSSLNGNTELYASYQRSLDAEFEERETLAAEMPTEKQKILHSKSRGKAGLGALLNAKEEEPKAEPVEAEAEVVIEEVKEDPKENPEEKKKKRSDASKKLKDIFGDEKESGESPEEFTF